MSDYATLALDQEDCQVGERASNAEIRDPPSRPVMKPDLIACAQPAYASRRG
jgi:hypothetical protein